MSQKDRIDLFGALALILFSLLLGFNQVVIKVSNGGIQPVFLAGLRSLGGVLCIYLWMRLRGIEIAIKPGTAPYGLLIGLAFSFEFVCLFMALDLTTVTRTSVIFYTMPVWMALGAHFLIPGETITRTKAIGLTLAFCGVVIAIVFRDRGPEGDGSLLGDLFAVGAAFAWASIALIARATPLKEVRPDIQLFWQLCVSAVVILTLSPFFGPFLRDPQAIHWAGLAFQVIVVVSAGFLLWMWLLSIYPPASVASFSFLAPIFGVGLGWLLLGETVGPEILVALGLVCGGLILINRPRKATVPA